MEEENLTERFLLWTTILKMNMNNFMKYKMEVNKKCDGNLQRRSIFKGIKLHNF